jgi:hypothetical protein
MLQQVELLPTIAEVSIALAGFASLISVLGIVAASEQRAAILWRLRGMLETAILTLAFSLAPYLPAKFGVSDNLSWHAVAVAFAAVVLGRMVFMLRARRLPALVNSAGARAIGGAQILGALVLVGACFLGSLDIVVGAYHLLLFVELLVSAYLFIRVALSVLTSAEPRA